MDERAEAEVGIATGMASTCHREVTVPMSNVTAAAVPVSHPGVETVGSSDGLVPRASSQPSIASERLRVSHKVPSLSRPGILRNGRVPNFEAALR